MEQNTSSILVQRILRKCIRRFQENAIPFLSSLLFGFLAYTFAFTNKLVCHDDVGQLFGKGGATELGRWGLELMEYIFPNFSMPWIYGVITIFLISISVCILIQTYRIRSRLLQVLLAGCILVFPSLIGLFAYMFTSTSYTVSFFLAVLAVFYLRKGNRFSLFVAFCCMILSLGIYQAYISFSATLMIVALIQDLLETNSTDKKENSYQVFLVLKRGILYVFFLLLSVAVYFMLQQMALKVKGTAYGAYAENAMRLDIAAIPQNIITAYLTFIRYFTWHTRSIVPNFSSTSAHFLLFVGGVTLFILRLWHGKINNPIRLGLLLVLIALLPLSINCMFLVTPAWSVHTLMLYSFTGLYLLAAIVADPLMFCYIEQSIPEVIRRFGLNLVTISLIFIWIGNTYTANAAYLQLHLKYENTYAFYSALLADMRMTPGFDEDTTIAIVGDYDHPDYYNYYLLYLSELMGVNTFSPDCYTAQQFFYYYLGIDIPFASDSEIQQIMQSAEFQTMSQYPYYGSLQMIGDYLVVKLS